MEWKIVHIDETDSTNRWLRECHNGVRILCDISGDVTKYPDPIVTWAEYQTAGKGCGTNSWESERGKNLTFSMLIHPEEIEANKQFYITEVVSVAMCRVLQSYIYNKVEIKWPNDIYVDDRKICGMLIENRLQGAVIKDSIIGIGLNVNQRVFTSDAPNPVSMIQLTGREIDREALLQAFLQAFEQAWTSDTVASDYRQLLYRREGFYPYEDRQGRFEARIVGIEPDGHLSLEDREGRRRQYAFKEVMFVIKN